MLLTLLHAFASASNSETNGATGANRGTHQAHVNGSGCIDLSTTASELIADTAVIDDGLEATAADGWRGGRRPAGRRRRGRRVHHALRHPGRRLRLE
jgi:hypothetical protein